MKLMHRKTELSTSDLEKKQYLTENMQNKLLRAVLDYFPAVFLILMLIVFGIKSDGAMFSAYNLKVLLKQSFLYIVGGLGVIFLFAQGASDFSLAANVALSSILATYVAEHSIFLGILTALSVGTAVGCINGLLYSRTRLSVFMVGLTMNFLISGSLLTILGKVSFLKVNKWFTQFTGTTNELIFIAIVLVIVGYFFLFTKFGRHCKAIGAGVVAAGQSGVNVRRTKFLAFAISGFTAGVVAILTMIRTGSVSTATGAGFHFNIMIAMVLGGVPITGGSGVKLRSVFIGAFINTVLLNGLVMWGMSSRVQEVLKGVLFVLVVVFSTRLREKLKR